MKTNSSSAKMTTIMPSETDVKKPKNESTLRINCHWKLKISYNYLTILHPQPYHKIICPGHITQCLKFYVHVQILSTSKSSHCHGNITHMNWTNRKHRNGCVEIRNLTPIKLQHW
jgi:hypothetical protein